MTKEKHKGTRMAAFFASHRYTVIACDFCMPVHHTNIVEIEPVKIPIYNSAKEAYAAGWRSSDNPELIPEGKNRAVLCPECAEKILKQK